MAGNSPSFSKRQKERSRQQKQAEKAQKRLERKQQKDLAPDQQPPEVSVEEAAAVDEFGNAKGFDFHDF